MSDIQFVTPNQVDTGALFQAFSPEYQLYAQKVAQGNAFKGGLPTDANGNIDTMAMAKSLYQKGAYDQAGQLLTIGNQQRAIQAGLAAANDLDGTPAAATPQAQPKPTAAGGNPEVVSYIRQKATSLGINPDVALAVAGTEGLRGFDPNGKPNLGDGGSSAGPYQLHYGGVAGGGNAAAGLGDDFTKATGLDARNSSTWKAQIDFALQHAAQNGWSAWHGAAKAGIGNFAGIGQAPVAGPQASAGMPPPQPQPTQVAQNGASDAPSSTHPYGPDSANAPSASAAPPSPSAAPVLAPSQVAGPGIPTASSVSGPASDPTSAAGSVSSATDPTLGGLLKGPWVGNPGGAMMHARAMAVRLGTLGNTAAATALNQQATAIENALTRSETPEIKNYATALRQGYTGTMMQFASDTAAQAEAARIQAQSTPAALRAKGQQAEATATGTAQGQSQYELVPTQPTPGGPIVMMPKSQILASSDPVVKSQPPVIGQQQEALGKTISAIPDQLRQRQVTRERIDAMSNLLQTFQSGGSADAKANALSTARAWGINIPDSATANPAAVEQFWKNAQANVFSQIKDQGGKVLVSEIQGFQKANANPNMQPASNAAIIAQQKGLLDWQDAHDQAMINWYHQNPYAYDASTFETQWDKANPPNSFVLAARKEIAPAGIPIPVPDQRVVGQKYNIPGKGIYRWVGNGWSAQ